MKPLWVKPRASKSVAPLCLMVSWRVRYDDKLEFCQGKGIREKGKGIVAAAQKRIIVIQRGSLGSPFRGAAPRGLRGRFPMAVKQSRSAPQTEGNKGNGKPGQNLTKKGSSRKVVGCTSLYTKCRCVTGATIAFATVLFTAKPCRVMKSYMPKSHNFS